LSFVMALILHIADLHLVSPSSSPAVDDHKTGLVPSGDKTTHHQMLHATLQRLGERLSEEGRTIDAIVVTGDIADKNNEGGYQAFLELINALGPAKPAPHRIVVLPGNHDVASGLRAGDARRYDRFISAIRGAGFVTPLLAGIDGPVAPTTEAAKHLVVFDDIQIIPIDSSSYSQVLMDVGISDASWANLEGALTGKPTELEALRGLRVADAARVSEDHLDAVRALLASVTVEGAFPLRIAALHHHLLPVSTREEVKPFESLTNLGLVREFLRDQGIAIVLHGHKHTRFTYLDHLSSYEVTSDKPSPLRVISGAAASSRDLDRTDVFRLVEVEPSSGLLRMCRIAAGIPGTTLKIGSPEVLTFSRPGAAQISGTAGCVVIDGPRVDVVYPQLVATVCAQVGEVDHVVCRIEHSPELNEIAPLYPFIPAAPGSPEAEGEAEVASAKRLEQFQDLVDWWQLPSAPLSAWDQPAFTHGSRIKRYDGYLDQIRGVIESLEADQRTSRGVVVLLNPPADRSSREFPSFCLVQFKVERPVEGFPTLNCTAYFRKQEVRYWWLVNLAELARLQREICDALLQRHKVQELRNIRPGSITTIAARARAGQSVPKVQVPLIDRYYSRSRERLFAMVNALVWEHMPDREQYAYEWLRLFFELNPPETPDPDGLAIAQEGLKYLGDEVGRHVDSNQSEKDEPLQALHHALELLLTANQGFALLQQNGNGSSERYSEWRGKVKPLIARIIELSYGRITAVSAKDSNLEAPI
jgi:3',5'-cyclic AMP phosphodiesterase CpdA